MNRAPLGALNVALALLLASNAWAATLTVAPHVERLAPDGFGVAFETDVECDAVVEVGSAKLASHGRVHRVQVTGLSPSQAVDYRVVVGTEVLAAAHTRAGPPDNAQSLDFLVYGDTRDGPATEHTIAVGGRAFAPALALHTGDIVPRGDDEASWRALFANEQPLLQETPLYLAIGNHELVGDPNGVRTRYYLPPPVGDEMYYSFRVGPARFIMLDSSRLDEAQLAFAERALRDATNEAGHPHTFVFLHHPPFSVGGHCGSFANERGLVELFERYRPSAVFAGHEHAYERLERNGVRYFVSGGGGAPLYAESAWCSSEDKAARRVYRAEHHLLQVRVRGEAIDVAAVLLDGTPIETTHFVRGEPTAASNTTPPSRAPYMLGGVLVLFVGAWLIRRRSNTRGRA